MTTSIDISYLADCVIVTRFYESQGEVCKAISVIKKRSGSHETGIRAMKLTGEGMKIGGRLKQLRGILSGTPVIQEAMQSEP